MSSKLTKYRGVINYNGRMLMLGIMLVLMARKLKGEGGREICSQGQPGCLCAAAVLGGISAIPAETSLGRQ